MFRRGETWPCPRGSRDESSSYCGLTPVTARCLWGHPALAAEYESTVTQFLTIKVYCTNIGDAGVPDIPHPSEDLDGAIEATGSRLAYNFKSKKGPKGKPTQSILVNDKNRILARFRMTPQGLERVEIGTEYAD